MKFADLLHKRQIFSNKIVIKDYLEDILAITNKKDFRECPITYLCYNKESRLVIPEDLTRNSGFSIIHISPKHDDEELPKYAYIFVNSKNDIILEEVIGDSLLLSDSKSYIYDEGWHTVSEMCHAILLSNYVLFGKLRTLEKKYNEIIEELNILKQH
jgi:hypothetical protein